jgi:hypothetical protein
VSRVSRVSRVIRVRSAVIPARGPVPSACCLPWDPAEIAESVYIGGLGGLDRVGRVGGVGMVSVAVGLVLLVVLVGLAELAELAELVGSVELVELVEIVELVGLPGNCHPPALSVVVQACTCLLSFKACEMVWFEMQEQCSTSDADKERHASYICTSHPANLLVG